MRVETLSEHGIKDCFIARWKDLGHETLLPIQALAVRRYGVLSGRNVVLFSPTSSGKTFVGEMAAVMTAGENRRTVYLAPQKALAEEKYHEFRRKYACLGYRTVISTRGTVDIRQR